MILIWLIIPIILVTLSVILLVSSVVSLFDDEDITIKIVGLLVGIILSWLSAEGARYLYDLRPQSSIETIDR